MYVNKLLLFLFGVAFCESFFLIKSIKKTSTKTKRSHLDVLSNSATETNSSELLSQLSIFSKSIPIYQSIDKDLYVSEGFERVMGCLSEVWVKCEFVGDNKKLNFLGTSDSLLIRGVLGVLFSHLRSASSEEIMHMSFENISSILPLYNNNLLSPGRLNGVQNILAAIKEQLSIISKNNKPISSIIVIPDETFTNVEEEEEEEEEVHKKGQGKLIVNDNTFTKFESPSQNISSPCYKEEVAMLLSGGVDSSVALKLLVDQGYTVRAFYLKIWLEDEVSHLNECPWEEDLRFAESVCDQLNIPLETVSLQKEYWSEVVQYTLNEAKLGRTPNPDIMCNSRVKFGVFYGYIGKYFKKIATGHYAQTFEENGRFFLKQSPDIIKDQTYFLCALTQDQLKKAIFPIGHLSKARVRELASAYNLPTKSRKDSQGICFLGKLKFDTFIEHYLGQNPGDIINIETSEILGRHKGLWFHTIGQRKGIGRLFTTSGKVNDGPWYIASKNFQKNELLITNNISLIKSPDRVFKVEHLMWINGVPELFSVNKTAHLFIKMRHGPEIYPCKLHLLNEKITKKNEFDLIREGEVFLDIVEKGIAPGQFTAFYDENQICLGSGIISLL